MGGAALGQLLNRLALANLSASAENEEMRDSTEAHPGSMVFWAGLSLLVLILARILKTSEDFTSAQPLPITAELTSPPNSFSAEYFPGAATEWTYFGRTLGAWFDQLETDDLSLQNRARAVLAGVEIPPEILRSELCRRLENSDPRLRIIALACLPTLPLSPTEALQFANARLVDPDPGVRAAAAVAIGAFQTEAIELIPALKQLARTDPDETVRKTAKETLDRVRFYDAGFMSGFKN